MVERLTPEEVSFFVREGYLVKPAALDPQRIAAARRHWWSHNRVERLRPTGRRPSRQSQSRSGRIWDLQNHGG